MNINTDTPKSETENTNTPAIKQLVDRMEDQLKENKTRIGMALDFYQTLLVIHEDLIWKKQMLEAEMKSRQEN